MALTKEKIVANAKKYFDVGLEHGFINDDLIKFLGEEFISAPFSTHVKYGNAFEGGLIDYSLKVASYCILINKSLSPDEKIDETSLLKISLLHCIGKAKMFVPCTSEWHRTNQGKMYEYNENITPMQVNERSIYYILNNGIKLSEDEYIAILSYNKTDDKIAEYHMPMMGEILKMGIILTNKKIQKSINV